MHETRKRNWTAMGAFTPVAMAQLDKVEPARGRVRWSASVNITLEPLLQERARMLLEYVGALHFTGNGRFSKSSQDQRGQETLAFVHPRLAECPETWEHIARKTHSSYIVEEEPGARKRART